MPLILALLLAFICAASAQVPMTGGGVGAPGASCSPSSLSLDFTTGSFPPTGASTTNSTGGTGHNDVGTYFASGSPNVLTLNSGGGLRPDYMASGSTRTLLYEPAASNLALQSNNFSTTWSKDGTVTIAGGAATSPDGTADGTTLTTVAAGAGVQQSITLTAVNYTFGLYFQKHTTAQNMRLSIGSHNGSLTATPTAWSRLVYTAVGNAGGTFEEIWINDFPAVVNIFGAQVEIGSVASSYIPTTTSAITRAADNLSGPAIPSCAGHFTITFDDNSMQSVTASWPLTTTLTRPNIKTIVGAS
jgi:hypothetical protein